MFGDEPDFSLYNFTEKAMTAKVMSGGWAIYTEPNFKGKVLYQLGSKLKDANRRLRKSSVSFRRSSFGLIFKFLGSKILCFSWVIVLPHGVLLLMTIKMHL